jgi:RNA polymerase sigma factor (TIGR02999 family)
MEPGRDNIRSLLLGWRAGDLPARDRLFEIFYPDLQQVAAGMLRYEQGVSISCSDLVHETVMRLIQLDRIDWQDKAHFLALSSLLMRRALIDQARLRRAGKRDHYRVELHSRIEGDQHFDLESVESALRGLAEIEPAYVEIVEMRYYGGMTLADIATVQACSEITVKRRWRAARAWLVDRLGDTGTRMAVSA